MQRGPFTDRTPSWEVRFVFLGGKGGCYIKKMYLSKTTITHQAREDGNEK